MTIIWYTRCFSTPKISRLFFLLYIPRFFSKYIKIYVDNKHQYEPHRKQNLTGWSGAFVFELMERTHFLCGISKGHSVFDPHTTVDTLFVHTLLPSAGHAWLSWQQKMQLCPCKAARKLSHINNNIQSSPCYSAGLASTWEDDSWQLPFTERSPSPFFPGSSCITLSSQKIRMQGKRTRRGSRWAALGCGHETVLHT